MRRILIAFAPLALAGGLLYASRIKQQKKESRPVPVIAPGANDIQTGYFHLESVSVSPGQRVMRGQPVGAMGADPNGGARHLHFEVAPYPFPGGHYSRVGTINPRPLLESGELTMPVERGPEGREPVVSSQHYTENPSRASAGKEHAGVDIMFERRDSDSQPVKKGEGTPGFIAPKGTRILAAHDGVVTRAGKIGSGWRIWIRRA